jgi:hypothetical protein
MTSSSQSSAFLPGSCSFNRGWSGGHVWRCGGPTGSHLILIMNELRRGTMSQIQEEDISNVVSEEDVQSQFR